MGRTPRPADSKPFMYYLSPENDAHVQSLMERLGKSTTEIIARELEFLRNWGLTPLRLPRLLHAMKMEGATPYQYVTDVLARAARQLPPEAPLPELPSTGELVRGNVNFSGAAQAQVLGYGVARNLSFTRSLDELLSYARTYGLTRGQLATLQASAHAGGGELRDLVLDLISAHVNQLPVPPQQPSQPTDLPPRRRRSTSLK